MVENQQMVRYLYFSFIVETQKKIISIFLSVQLWKFNGFRMINKADVLQSTDKRELKNNDSKCHIMNISEDKVLSIENGQINMEAFGLNDEKQVWEKGEANDEGFFTLTNTDTEKVLTSTYLNGLSIEGMLF